MNPRLTLLPVSSNGNKITVKDDLRARIATVNVNAGRAAGLIGRHWTTEEAVAEAERLLIQIAEDALVARRLLAEMNLNQGFDR